MEYCLGIDYGAKKIGLALADRETKIAHALEEVERRIFLGRLKELKREFSLQAIIVGANLAYDKNIQETNLGFEKFKKNIQKEFPGREVIEQEEFFSTQLAQKNLLEAKKKRVNKQDNSEAARLILQSWLDKSE